MGQKRLSVFIVSIFLFSLVSSVQATEEGDTVAQFGTGFDEVVIADSTDGLFDPRDLEFHPGRADELWIANRGDDSIVTFAVDQMGLLSNPSFTTSGGACPRHFTLDPSGQWLLVANQDTNNIVVFRLKNDRPAEIVCERVLPKPVCLHFLA